MNTKQFLKEYYNYFERKTRDNGSEFFCLKDNTPDEIKELNMRIHNTDIMPDDFRYNTIHSLLSNSIDYLRDDETLEDLRDDGRLDEIIDGSIDIYIHDLNKWLSSNLNRSSYVDQANDELGQPETLTRQLMQGQYIEISEIAHRMIDEINEYLEELEG